MRVGGEVGAQKWKDIRMKEQLKGEVKARVDTRWPAPVFRDYVREGGVQKGRFGASTIRSNFPRDLWTRTALYKNVRAGDERE